MDQGFHSMQHLGPDESINPTGLRLNDCSRVWGYDRTANQYDWMRDSDGNILAEAGCPDNGSWFRDGYLQRYNLSVRGGSETFSYFASGQWGRQEGVVSPNEGETYSVRANFSFQPLDNLEVRFNNMYSRRDIQMIPDGNNAGGLTLNVLRGQNGYTPGNRDDLLLENQLLHTINHYITGLQLNWSPVPSVTQRLNVGLDYEAADFQDFKPWGFIVDPPGDREDDYNEDRNITFDYAGTWTADLGDIPSLGALSAFSSSLSWGAQFYDEFSYGLNGFDSQFAGPGDQLLGDGTLPEVFEARTRIRSGGFFLQEQLGWRDLLFVTVGARWDGYSTFGENIDFEMYPKVQAAYTISDESFFPDWGQLKLRGAYGVSGRAPGSFDAVTIYEATSGDDRQPAVIIGNLGNPDLGPERSKELELGFEGSAWDGRATFEFTWYEQSTEDALRCISPAASTGIAECAWHNVGQIDNRGNEASLNLLAFQSRTFDWEIGGRYAHQRNKIVNLGEIDNLGSSYQVGYEFPIYYNDWVLNPDAVGELPDMERRYIGPQYPTDIWSLSTRLTFMDNLTLDVLGEGQQGHYNEAGTAYQNTRRGPIGEWPSCWPIRDALRDLSGSDQAQIDAANALLGRTTALWRARCDPQYWDYGVWTQAADFFTLRSTTLSYRLPENLLPGVRSTTLRLQARNLWTSTDYEGLGHDTNDLGEDLDRFEYYNIPSPRSFIFNVTVNF